MSAHSVAIIWDDEMILSLDYDDTYTRDPVFWNNFVEAALARGHTVYCVTARSERHLDDVEFTLGRLIGSDHIIGTNGEPKRRTVSNMDIMVDVWIDDSPEMIVS